MHVHFTYQRVPRTPHLDKVINAQVRKLEKLLAHFSPDLVHLRGALESNAAHSAMVCSLNLALPTGQIHARREGLNLITDLQECFNNLVDQLKKHKAALRREEDWNRQNPKISGPLETTEAEPSPRKT